MNKINQLMNFMIEYESGCPKRVNHFLKVYSFAKLIAENELADEQMKLIIESVSLVHDIGIKPSLEKYKSSSGKYQEIEGPTKAKPLLESLGFSNEKIDRICYLIAHHHTYDNIDGLDYQILIEADFLVNIFEDNLSKIQIEKVRDCYFKTKSGLDLLNTLYLK